MSVDTEISSLRGRSQIMSKRGHRWNRFNIYIAGLIAKIEQTDFALRELKKVLGYVGETVTTTSSADFLSPSQELYFYGDSFWAFMYSTLDVLAQIINQALHLGKDEDNVTFGGLVEEVAQNSVYSDTPLQEILIKCKKSHAFKRLKKYRNTSVHRRRVYIGRKLQAGPSEYHSRMDSTSGETATFVAGPFILCDDPYELTPTLKQMRTIPKFMESIRDEILEYIEKILKGIEPIK